MTWLSFLLCAVALTTFSSISSYGYHMLPETKDKLPCLNDGFRNDTGSCICKDSNYISGENCEEWKCVNFGRGLARFDKDNQPFYVCDCPLGFRGPHCEATACIPNSDGFIKAFNPVERSFTIVITYNNDTQAVINRGDKIIDSITEMLTNSPFDKNIDRLHIVPIGSQTPDKFDCLIDLTSPTSLSDCFKSNMELYVDPEFYGPLNVYSLTTSDILSAIKDASTHSSVLLISNLGLKDYDNITQLNLISQSAIARQIEFNVMLIESADAQGQNIFYSDKYIPLIQLAHKTLGTFINPYKINGGYNVMKVQDMIPSFGKLIATKTLVDFGVWEGTGLSSVFNLLLGDGESGRDIYISVAANSPYSTNISATVQSSPDGLAYFDLTLDAGIWKLFKYTYSQTFNSYQVFYQLSEACTFHIWTAPQTSDAPAQPNTFIGFLTDSVSDANYPIAVKGVDNVTVSFIPYDLKPIPNTLVAHLYNAGSNLQNILATVTIGNDTIKNSSLSRATQRNCLFNLQFAPIICGNKDDYGTIQIKVDGPAFFQQTVPITCGTPEDTQQFSLANDNALKKRFKNTKNEEKAAVSSEKDAYTCSHSGGVTLDPLAPKTFVLAFPNYKSLTNVLFDGRLNTSTFVKTLKDYCNSYNSSFFTNFVLAPYVVTADNNTVPKVNVSTNYLDFQFSLVNAYGQSIDNDPNPISLLNQESILDSLITFPQVSTFSEIFIITNKPYIPSNETDIKKNLANRRIKLNFLIYDDGSFQGFSDRDLLLDFYDLAAHSGGNVILCDEKQNIQAFFDNYRGMQQSQISVSSYNDAIFVGIETAGEFIYVEGKNYYIQAAVKYESGSTLPEAQLKSNSAPDPLNVPLVAVIGKYYALFKVPNNTLTGKYTVNIVNYDISPIFFANVVEVNPDDLSYYVVGFVSDPTYDIQQTYPSFSGSDSRVFIVAKVGNDDSSEVTIAYPHNQVIYNGEAESRDSCTYNLITSDYKWQCPVENQLYYVILETSTTTRTSMFPCYSSTGGGDNPDGGNCQNGGTADAYGNCVCPPGWEGKNCGDPVCYNGGTIAKNNTCICPEYYTGDHCETTLFSCQRDIPFPRFTSLLETLVLVVDLQISDIGTFSTSLTIDDIPPVFQQYILVGAYQSGEDKAIIQVYDSPQDFLNAIRKLTLRNSPRDARFAIKRALQAVKTDRTLLIWLGSAQIVCGTDNNVPEPDDELLNLIAKRKVELRAFADSTVGDCFQMVSSYGNGVPLKYRNIQSVFDYINMLVPATVTDKSTQTDNLVVIDSYITDECEATYNVALAIDSYVFGGYKDLHVIVFNLNMGDGLTSAGITDVYMIQKNKFTLTRVSSSTTYCGYIVEAKHTSRIAYEVTQSDNFEAEGYGVFYAADKTNLNIYFENGLQEIQSFNDFPEAFTANVEYTNFTYEHAAVIRRNCTYPWSVETKCNGFNGALKTKLIMKDEEGDLHQRLVTTYCIKRMSCSSYGTPLLADDKADDDGISRKVWTCGCNPLWSGTDCSIPVCLNGGTPNRESCNCPAESYGSNCEIQKSLRFDGNSFPRSILIILDVTGSEEQLDSRKDLLSQFLNMYKAFTNTYYSFVTNVEGGQQIGFTSDQSRIRAAINSSLLSNDTIDLAQAFEYFNGQSNLWVNPGNIEANGIFYISDSSIDPEEDLTALFKLHDKGFYLYSAYYYANTDPSIPRLADLSGLGGTTGSWTVYDILVDFAKFLQGGDLSVVPPPPSTTTPRPIPCISKFPMDIVFVVDPSISSVDNYPIFFGLRDMISLRFAPDLKFASPGNDEASRASLIVVNMSPGFLLCLTSAASLKDSAQNIGFQLNIGTTSVDLNQTFNILNGLISPTAVDYRKVPKFTIFITDRPDIKNQNDIVNFANNMSNITNFAVIGVGNGDFLSSYGQFATDGMLFNIPKNTATAVSDVQEQLYARMCSAAEDFGSMDTDYICPAVKSDNRYSFWT